MTDDSQQPPARIEEVASLDDRRKEIRDGKFFEIRRPQYPDCTHQWRGVTLDTGTRRVFCKCGEQIDAFDALLIYANSERRLQETREVIEEHNRKEAEKKARRPFAREWTGWSRRPGGFELSLTCGHQAFWSTVGRTRFKDRPPKTMTCEQCVRKNKLEGQGVAVVGGSK